MDPQHCIAGHPAHVWCQNWTKSTWTRTEVTRTAETGLFLTVPLFTKERKGPNIVSTATACSTRLAPKQEGTGSRDGIHFFYKNKWIVLGQTKNLYRFLMFLWRAIVSLSFSRRLRTWNEKILEKLYKFEVFSKTQLHSNGNLWSGNTRDTYA